MIPESTVIMESLEEAFSMLPLMPPDPYQRAMTRVWLKKTDELHTSCAMVTFSAEHTSSTGSSASAPEFELIINMKTAKSLDLGSYRRC